MRSPAKAWRDLPPLFADRLMALLTAPDRSFHDLARTNRLLVAADRHAAPHWLRPLRWAILYRHAVHDPLASATANAESCAELWLEHFPALHETVRNVSAAFEDNVATTLRAAADPFARPAGLLAWQHAFLDLDCGWLGEPERLYEAGRLCLAEEFAQAGGTQMQWRERRQEDCAAALASPALFQIILRERTAAAHANVARELRALT